MKLTALQQEIPSDFPDEFAMELAAADLAKMDTFSISVMQSKWSEFDVEMILRGYSITRHEDMARRCVVVSYRK